MQVMIGWTGETEPNRWRKIEVTLDETDLLRMLKENDLFSDGLTTVDVFKLLEIEANRLVLSEIATRFNGMTGDQYKVEMSLLDIKKMSQIEKIKSKMEA